ncbi:MAG: DNA mismatch repair endonuclease MutL [Gammaproteobacteria bacterium]|nr:DNA mismatch repair endonuclease MutL [Gammaproteobacteria bacterium]
MQADLKSRKSIQQLSTQLANQIAAGEVIERPASVVKELLENSIDAGATQIDIDIQAGGTQQIRIRDNGYGIPQDELPLALSPHATSKIRSLDDLIHIASMGFRGEALASIASVSELTLTSHHRSNKHGDMAWSIKSKEGQFDLTPASHPQGTTVEVNNLFYNTPARRKFLKAERTEYRHIEDVVKRMALAYFDVAINFRHNQRQVFSLPMALSNENKLQRLTRLINKEFIQAAVQLNFENAGLKLSGWLANAEYSRSQSDMQYFFVNGRMIRDKVITHAVRQAFQETLYPGRFPVYVLHLEMDPEQVDVNVHPTKHEVRFRQGRLIHDFLFYSLREALAQEGGLNSADSLNKKGRSFNSHTFPSLYNSGPFNSSHHGAVSETAAVYLPYNMAEQSLYNKDLNKPLGVALTKLKNNYLLTQNQHGLLVLQLAQARKILIQRQIKLALAEQEKLISKPVLIPFSIHLEVNAPFWLDKNTEQLQQLGFELAVLGENEVMVRHVPAMLNVSDIKKSIQQYINLVVNNEPDFLQALIDIIIGDDFSQSPADWNMLLRDLENNGLDQIQNYYHQISDNDFSRWFKK